MTNRVMFCPDGLTSTNETTIAADLVYYGFPYTDNSSTLSNPVVSGTIRKLTITGLGGGSPSFINFPISGTAPASGFIGMRVSTSSTSGTNVRLFELLDGATIHLYGVANSDGSMTVYRGDGTSLGASSAASIPVTGTEFFLEIEFTIANAAGVCKLYRDGSSSAFLSITGADTQNGASAQITNFNAIAMRAALAFVLTLRDVYMNDTLGSYNNTKWGDTRIARLSPAAEVTTAFTPSTGTDNAALVGKTPMGTGSNVSSATAGHIDRNTLGNLSVTPSTIYAVRTNLFMDKSDAGARTARSLLYSDASTGTGSTQTPGTSALVYTDVFERDPNGTIAWAAAAVNALDAGYEVVA